MRLASTERDPDKPFGAPLGSSAHVSSSQLGRSRCTFHTGTLHCPCLSAAGVVLHLCIQAVCLSLPLPGPQPLQQQQGMQQSVRPLAQVSRRLPRRSITNWHGTEVRSARAAEVSYSYGAMNNMFGTAGSPAKLKVAPPAGLQSCSDNAHALHGWQMLESGPPCISAKEGTHTTVNGGVCVKKSCGCSFSHKAVYYVEVMSVHVVNVNDKGQTQSCR